jgi:hypothetical protein
MLLNCSQRLDQCPALVWIRGEKVENIVEGKKQGAGFPKGRSFPLAPSARSRVSKVGYYALASQVRVCLMPPHCSSEPASETYYQAKHDYTDDNIALYQRIKGETRGRSSTEEQQRMVNDFLESATERPHSVNDEAESVSPIRLTPASPFYGWLVSGEAFESFDTHGIHRPHGSVGSLQWPS